MCAEFHLLMAVIALFIFASSIIIIIQILLTFYACSFSLTQTEHEHLLASRSTLGPFYILRTQKSYEFN